MFSKRYSKDSNKYLIFYDPKPGPKYILFLVANNLHGYAMSKFHPTSGFKWIDPKAFDLETYANNSSKDCVLEVHLEYPKELRGLYRDYPLALDKIEIKKINFV